MLFFVSENLMKDFCTININNVHLRVSFILYQEGTEELKTIVGCISKLRNEVQTNKPVIAIKDDRTDTVIWNNYLQEVTDRGGGEPRWFESPWLYVECYMYRRVQEAVEKWWVK